MHRRCDDVSCLCAQQVDNTDCGSGNPTCGASPANPQDGADNNMWPVDSQKTDWTFEPDGKTLNEIAPSLSVITEGKENLQWAIDPMVDEPYKAELFLYTPDSAQ